MLLKDRLDVPDVQVVGQARASLTTLFGENLASAVTTGQLVRGW